MFDDIRPYSDAEVRPILDRIVRNPELLRAVRGVLLPSWAPRRTSPIDPLISLYLRWQTRSVNTVADLQQIMEKYLVRVVQASTSGFSVSGLEYVPRDRACLFVGNHRDIALDPAFMSYALKRSGLETCRVAIGDNLLSKPFVADLLRLNKCFIVQRSAAGPRQMLKRYQQLSQFIQHSIVSESASVWIAQREGRAKNGNDTTEAAIIKMLHMAGKKQGASLAQHFADLCLIPVSISYEYDPCDGRKARELHAVSNQGEYEKEEHEDIASIAQGVQGQKGRVHLSFAPPINLVGEQSASTLTAEQIAQRVDAAIHREYRLHPSNIFAYKYLHNTIPPELMTEVFGPKPSEELVQRKATEFLDRLQSTPEEYRHSVAAMYAAPVGNKLSFTAATTVSEANPSIEQLND